MSKIDTDTLRTVALSYDTANSKPDEPKQTRRGNHVRHAADELDRLYAHEARTTPFKDRAALENALTEAGLRKFSESESIVHYT